VTEDWPDHLPADWRLAPSAADAGRYRRQQRRRAIIAWVTAVVAVGLVVLAAILAPAEEEGTIRFVAPGYAMTSEQYGALETGLDEGEFLDRLGQTGLTEAETGERYVALFPPREDELTCSYWQISDQVGKVARICFDEDGELAQKLERTIGEEPTGVTV
jgi:hypothetical protein